MKVIFYRLLVSDFIAVIRFIGTAQRGKQSLLYYSQNEGGYDYLKVTSSHDGFTFSDKSTYVFVFDLEQKETQNYDWKSVRITKQDSQYLLTYNTDGKLSAAFSSDLVRWQQTGEIEGISETATVVSDFMHNNQYVMYFGDKDIRIAYSSDLQHWTVQDETLLSPRDGSFDSSNLEVGNAFELEDAILVTYYVKKEVNGQDRYFVGAAYFDKTNPSVCLWRSELPLWEQANQLQGEKLMPLGSVIMHDELVFYWVLNENTIFAVSTQIPEIRDIPESKAFSVLVKKFHKNPIIAPRPEVPWESRATFNSAALYEDGKVHFLYRALGDKDLSVLGYATSKDGLTIDHRSDIPAYIPREPFETPGGNAFKTFADHFASGGGYGGVEDPRITRVEDRVYLTYVAFDGATPPRAAMSSIHIDDFLENNWERWDTPKLISAPGMVNKSAVVLPRKVNGKYVMLHRVYPNILVDYLDNLEFDEYLQGHYFIPPRKNFWDSKKVGAGAPPIETKDGWLLIYQSVGYQDPSRYKIGAMMLDINNPAKVLYRTHMPIIEPVEPYENNGFKSGVVYPCGAVIMKDKLYIYYGGADSYVNAASADIDTFLDEMKHNQEPKLTTVTSGLFN